IGVVSQPAITGLIGLLADKDTFVRFEAATAFRSLGPRTIPHLIPILRSSDTPSAQLAAQILGKFGAQAKSALPALQQAAREGAPLLRPHARRAIAQIQGK